MRRGSCRRYAPTTRFVAPLRMTASSLGVLGPLGALAVRDGRRVRTVRYWSKPGPGAWWMVLSPEVNWEDAAAEATALLSEFIAVDTSNPPGNEEAACSLLGAVLRREGLEYELYESGPGRVSLRAVLAGDGSAGPLILLNHTDVVPVEREYWTAEPFGGEVRDGYVWGRGALDMKGMGIFELMAVLLLKRLGLPLRRDVVFFAMADEEMGGEFGINWFVENHPDLLKGDFCLNEGAYGWARWGGVERPFFGFSPTEKNPLWLRLRAEGPPGHGSLPHGDNALGRLVRALDRIQTWGRERVIVPEMR